MMEIEDVLRLACDEGSSLTRSFWYGKFLQLLPKEETVKYSQPLTHHGAQSTLINSSEAAALSQPTGGEEEKIARLTHAQALSSSDGGNVDSMIQFDTKAEQSNKKHRSTDNIDLRSAFCSPDFERLGPHITEALKCLKHCETSLSPNVYDLVVNSIQSAPLERLMPISESTFLLKDCTLDWAVVSVHFNNGNLTYCDLNLLHTFLCW